MRLTAAASLFGVLQTLFEPREGSLFAPQEDPAQLVKARIQRAVAGQVRGEILIEAFRGLEAKAGK